MDDLKHTPGPWAWFGHHGSQYYLATVNRGRQYVMGFEAFHEHDFGKCAQPLFQVDSRMKTGDELCIFEVAPEAKSPDDPKVYRKDITGFRNADARLIAAAPEILEALVAMLACVETCPDNGTAIHYAGLTKAEEAARALLKRLGGETDG